MTLQRRLSGSETALHNRAPVFQGAVHAPAPPAAGSVRLDRLRPAFYVCVSNRHPLARRVRARTVFWPGAQHGSAARRATPDPRVRGAFFRSGLLTGDIVDPPAQRGQPAPEAPGFNVHSAKRGFFHNNGAQPSGNPVDSLMQGTGSMAGKTVDYFMNDS
jgi:hypothetical protein